MRSHDPTEPEAGLRVAGRPSPERRLRRLTPDGVGATDVGAERTGVRIDAFVLDGRTGRDLSMTYARETGGRTGSGALRSATAPGVLGQPFFDIGRPAAGRDHDDRFWGRAGR